MVTGRASNFRTDRTCLLICFFQGNRKYCPAIYVMNKIDQITIEELDIIAEVGPQ